MRDRQADIRPAKVEDARSIGVVYAPYVRDTAVSFEDAPPSDEELRRRIAAAPRLPWLVAARDGTVVGFAYAAHHRGRPAYRWSVECSVYLKASAAGEGTGRALYEALLDELRALRYATALAGITLPNAASVALHEALGFQPVGVFRRVGFKHGRWHDVGWWQLRLTDGLRPDGEPIPWEA